MDSLQFSFKSRNCRYCL